MQLVLTVAIIMYKVIQIKFIASYVYINCMKFLRVRSFKAFPLSLKINVQEFLVPNGKTAHLQKCIC